MRSGRDGDAVEVVLDVSAVPVKPAGAGRYIVELARALGQRPDVDLGLVTRREDTGRWRAVAPQAALHAWVPNARPVRLAYERAVLGRRVATRCGRGAVYHGPHYTLPAGLAGPKVVTFHDLTFFDHPEWHEAAKVNVFRAAIRRSARIADVVVCVSPTTARRLAELIDVKGEVVVAEHGVDHDRFRPGEVDTSVLPSGLRAAGAAAQAGGGGAGLILHVGTLEPRKGIVDLVDAFGRLAASRPLVQLVLVGLPGWGAAEVTGAVAASPARDRIVLPGFVSDEAVVTLMRAADVVAYPSREEGFGLPALEAMAVGATLVTTEGTAMADFSEGAAWLARPGDPVSLASAISAALDAPAEERARRRGIGLERSAAFTWQRTADLHVAAYRQARDAAVLS